MQSVPLTFWLDVTRKISNLATYLEGKVLLEILNVNVKINLTANLTLMFPREMKFKFLEFVFSSSSSHKRENFKFYVNNVALLKAHSIKFYLHFDIQKR